MMGRGVDDKQMAINLVKALLAIQVCESFSLPRVFFDHLLF